MLTANGLAPPGFHQDVVTKHNDEGFPEERQLWHLSDGRSLRYAALIAHSWEKRRKGLWRASRGSIRRGGGPRFGL
jgi:hypothetical protein